MTAEELLLLHVTADGVGEGEQARIWHSSKSKVSVSTNSSWKFGVALLRTRRQRVGGPFALALALALALTRRILFPGARIFSLVVLSCLALAVLGGGLGVLL